MFNKSVFHSYQRTYKFVIVILKDGICNFTFYLVSLFCLASNNYFPYLLQLPPRQIFILLSCCQYHEIFCILFSLKRIVTSENPTGAQMLARSSPHALGQDSRKSWMLQLQATYNVPPITEDLYIQMLWSCVSSFSIDIR